MGYRAVVFQVQLFISIFFFQVLIPTLAVADSCKEAAGKLASIQGEAQVLRSGLTAWGPLQLNEAFCPGDMLRVNTGGRVAVVLANESVLRVDQNSTLIFQEATVKKFSLIKLLNGVLHIFSHRPRSLNIATPYVNGAVEGTEFLVQSGPDNTVITVFEGLVTAANAQGKLAVASGQAIVADKGTAPRYMTIVRPRDAVQWTLYYPAIIDMPEGEEHQPENELIRQASAGLAVGRVQEAREIIARVLETQPTNSEAIALQAMIEVVQNNKEQALILAAKAVELNPRSAAAALALSYAQQAHFDIVGALATLEKADAAQPGNAELKARLAELQLSAGELEKAQKTAEEAVRLNPNIGRSQAVLGFAFLTRIETEEAQAAFRKAIALDPALPLTRLGLGLALIREGKLEEGRAEIEIAVALDPGNALIRSYLGKAYYEEKRDILSSRQYETAKSLDPADPTPWFYDALRKQSINRPVEALRDLQKSIELNDNRAVYRSRFLLDEDLATRSASLGRIYNDLGFQQLALVEGWKSVNTDPANYSAHRFLADSYSALPRHEIARVSELLQSQLLQPLNITPVQPQLAESNLFILDGAGPADASLNEYAPLFLRNRLAFMAGGVAGGNETLGDEVVQSGVWNKFSYSLGQFHYETDGFRENNDQEQDIQNAYVQYSVSTDTSILAEIRNTEREAGDLQLLFDPEWFSNVLRQENDGKIGRFGFRHSFSPASKLLGVVSVEDYEETFKRDLEGGILANHGQWEVYLAEIQHQVQSFNCQLTSGVGLYDADFGEKTELSYGPSIPDIPITEGNSDISHANGYLYSQIDFIRNVNLIVGMSYDVFDDDQTDKDQFNPKLGLVINPLPQTTLRVAAFRVLTRSMVADQTIEPTQVAGFNQFYKDAAKVGNWIYGAAIDQIFTNDFLGGFEITARRQDVPYERWKPLELSGSPEFREVDWQENLARLYLYWTPSSWFSSSAEYFLEDFDRGDEFIGTGGFQELKTHRLRLGGKFFHSSGMFMGLFTTYVDQNGEFFDPLSEKSMQDNDQFWVVDGSIGYRLSKRRGSITLEARNLFDQDIRYQDTDPGNPRISPDQLLLFRITLIF